jgi:hypothetical protein
LLRLEEQVMALRHRVVRRPLDRVFAAGMQLLPGEWLEDVESDIAALKQRLGELMLDDDED